MYPAVLALHDGIRFALDAVAKPANKLTAARSSQSPSHLVYCPQ